ncbi:MAG: LON peptidase substrate-binding domain-containing protein [Gammaproteobacteria bacterium]|nr:LON peptidase substrate-binding domain-containing protein [Gammaproteobacteria bacterium]
MSCEQIPIFPLHTVLFPGGPLPLRVFEPRYTDMVSQCLKSGHGFGVCLIREGNETGPAAASHEVGTVAQIEDWHMRRDGLLGIEVRGDKKFRVKNLSVAANQLLTAQIEYLDDEPIIEVPPELMNLVDLLEERISQMGERFANMELKLTDATWVGYRLAEVLPLRLSQKQYFLQLEEPLRRLDHLSDVLQHIDMTC